MTARDRSDRTAAADALCVAAFEKAGPPAVGVSLVAVGGYGRGELAPYSDLDVILLHDDAVDPGEAAEQLWYPLWDSSSRLDHSVRTFSETVTTAGADLKVALGLLDARHVAGDPHLTLRLRATMLAEWRRDARERLPALRELVERRHELLGELAHVSVPDLKEAAGGIRDATVLRALVATWLVDVPHVELERQRQALLDVRDLLHGLAGRASDRVTPEHWSGLAVGLGLADQAAAQVHVRAVARRLTHVSRLTWRRVEAVLARPTSPRRVRAPEMTSLAPGVALSGGEVVLETHARPERDPLLLLRAAAAAAEHDVVLAPATAGRLARESAPLPEPWSPEARRLLVRLLASGRGLLAVWETLEETGALSRILPEWERLRLLPHASPVHRFTVDRHVVETCIEASALIRNVARPDVLMVSALLHDIGKGGLTEHSIAGEPIARRVARRMGFGAEDVDLVATLVRWHLLLSQTATTRDPEDPATVAHVGERLADAPTVALLLALTEADARATAPKAWSGWREGLVRELAGRVLASMDEPGAALDVRKDVEIDPLVAPGGIDITVEEAGDGSRVTVVARDRVGLLADVAAVFALQRATVRAARAWTQDHHAVSRWDLAEHVPEAAVLRQRYDAVVAGRVDPLARWRPAAGVVPGPSVVVRADASQAASVLEIRAADRPGVLHLTLSALAALGLTVCSAHADTLGPQAVDVFYVQEEGAGVLSEPRAAAAAHAVRAVLDGDLSLLSGTSDE